MTEHSVLKDLQAPGPGVWQLDITHWSRPLPRFDRDGICAAFTAGQADWMPRYGAPLATIRAAHVDGFVYLQPQPLSGPPDAAPPPAWLMRILTRLIPTLRRCSRIAEQALADRIWREDARRWDQEQLPGLLRSFRELQAVELEGLDDNALLAHLRAASETCFRSVRLHIGSNGATMIPTGLLLAQLRDWGVDDAAEVMVAVGAVSPLLEEEDALLRRLVDLLGPEDLSGPPDQVLRSLRERDTALGEAARAWLDRVQHRQIWAGGVYLLTGDELPQMLVEQLRRGPQGRPDSREEAAKGLRERVPEPQRMEFDHLLAEARSTAHIRNERSTICDAWAGGLLRRALLAVGRRLVVQGRLSEAEHAVHLTDPELEGLLLRGQGPEPAQVEAWARAQARPTDIAPIFLGGAPQPPPAPELFPEALRRLLDGVISYVDAMEGDLGPAEGEALDGTPASPGTYVGIARVVDGVEELARVQPGDVLVARATMPSYNGALAIAGAVVTDRGGVLSHAAIVSRELGLPAVVGTKVGTRRVPDGARVRVDGSRGLVELL